MQFLKVCVRNILVFTLVLLINFNIVSYGFEEEEATDYIWLEEEITNVSNNTSDEPKLNSKCAVVLDRSSKTVLFGKNENKRVPMASTTKIMTAIIAIEKLDNLEEQVEVSKQAAIIGGSRLGLRTGDKITYNDLLYGLMLCSGNDAAIQIAVSISGDIEGFARLMNNKSKELGLKHTNFVTPHGLDSEKHYTTALELAKITDYALNVDMFKNIVATKTYTININGYSKTLRNTNELLGYLNGVNGVKTGFTNGAGRCLVTSISRNDFDIIVVVLGADTKKMRTRDSIILIEYTYKNYELVNLEEIVKEEFEKWKNINQKRIKVYKGKQKNVNVALANLEYKKYPILKIEKNNIKTDINSVFRIKAPVLINTKIGKVKITLNSTQITEVDIVTNETLDRKNIWDYLLELFMEYQFSSILGF